MSRYGAAVTAAGVNTANTAYFQIRPNATSQRVKVLQIVIAVATAPTTAPVFYLSRSTAIGTNSSTLAGQPFDPSDTSSIVNLDGGFSAAPTFSTTNLMAVGPMAVTIGGGWVWDFRDMPIILAASTTAGLVIANANASGATLGSFRCSAMWQE